MSTLPAERDPGPMARLEELKSAGAETMSVIEQRVAEGETLRKIAEAWKVPAGRLAMWILEDEDRNRRFVSAMRACDTMRANEIHELADEVTDKLSATKARLRMDAVKWSAPKWDPERFGDRSTMHVEAQKNQTADERDRLLLETARSVAFVLQSAADRAAQTAPAPPKQLPPPAPEEPPI